MKPKYYPHVTIFAASAMVLLPLCFVLALPHLWIDEFEQTGELLAEIPGTPGATVPLNPAFVDSDGTLQAVVAETAVERLPVPEEVVPTTRLAMRPDRDSYIVSDVPATVSGQQHSEQPASPIIIDTDAVLDMAAIDEMVLESPEILNGGSVPSPRSTNDLPSPVAPNRVVAEAAQRVSPPVDEVELAMSDTASDDFVAPEISAPTYFDATGHLSMAGGALGAMAGTTPPRPVVSKDNDQKSDRPSRGSSTSRSSSRTRSAASQKSTSQPAVETPIQGFDSPWVVPGDGFGTQKENPIVDVILQQPLESRPVARMENVVAVSREKGWPIALVKSDLPDDHWWVQQMVGVRGNAFAARVNFGNEYSISGSVYQMVFVFLDSPDEVRRFRIAKQFEQVPEGVRRSREFTFVRK